jgi:ketosteroid isomerase-like protein
MDTQLRETIRRVERLEAVRSIKDLKSRYHTFINDTDFEKVGTLFTDDASVRLGYLMPSDDPVEGKANISRAFTAMKTYRGQSQLKQFLHNHVVDLSGEDSATGTGMLLACYGIGEDSYLVAGKYDEAYRRVDGAWLFSAMFLTLYFTVPLDVGWAGHKRHYLVNSGQRVPNYPDLLPNPAV